MELGDYCPGCNHGYGHLVVEARRWPNLVLGSSDRG